jgi:hypothetical protein
MRHYLQRLVANALQPADNVHPILDPVFATPKPWAGAPLEADAVVASRSREAAPPATASDFSSPETADSTAEIGGRQPVAPSDSQPAIFMPPLPATVAQLSPAGTPSYVPRHRPGAVSLTNDAQTADDEKPRHRAIEGQPVQPTGEFPSDSDPLESVEQQHSLAPHTPTPLVPEALRPRFGEPARLHVAGPRPGKPFGTDRRTSEPDEIQIHIGRIEVTAVQAGPPTPVVQRPQRWSPSLQEYLRRHDRKGA